jgi:uncharacterized protein (TIGR02453 family)
MAVRQYDSLVASPFTARTLSFLRSLSRNNDRDWFRARKTQYEQVVRAPMVELLARLARDFRRVAPELVSDPKVSLYRIYRDTRFSEDKRPLKTHVAAHFPPRGAARGTGAGLYVEIAPRWVWIGGGMYMPDPAELRVIREHISDTHPRLHRIATARPFTQVFGELAGDRLTRLPRGYAPEHPAATYLRYKQFLAARELPPEFAVSDGFYPELLRTFRAAMPLVRFLNAALERRPAGPLLVDDAPRRTGATGRDLTAWR